MNPNDNIARVAKLEAEVRNHPICLSLEAQADGYLVMYPAGMIIDGARASIGQGKAVALTRLLVAMEKHYLASTVH